MNFPYRKLPDNHFRLLSVVPGTHERDLRFKFMQSVPGQTQPYTAVSYTWGNDVKSEIICVDGRAFLIRPNLWACLHCLRHEWQLIWADAVCIDQNNVTEKNEQVSIMEQIYANATVVSVWLGLVPVPEWIHLDGPIVTLEVEDFYWEESIEDLANRPYWSRTWVIQEFFLARAVHLYCSNTRVDDHFFREMQLKAANMSLLHAEVADLVSQPDVMRKWLALPFVIGRHIDGYPDLRQPLYDLLAAHAYAESKDPRDKVFALLGLVYPTSVISYEKVFRIIS